MKLKDREVEKVACFKIGKFGNEELENEDFEKVEELNISNRKFSGESKNVSLEELKLFPNLRRVSLQYFTLNDLAINVINSLQQLEELQLGSCKFENNDQLKNINLQSLFLNCCEVKDYTKIYSPKKIIVTGDEYFRLDKLDGKENLERIIFQASRVKGFESIRECSRLRTLTLEETKVNDKRVLEDIKGIVEVHETDEYTPIR